MMGVTLVGVDSRLVFRHMGQDLNFPLCQGRGVPQPSNQPARMWADGEGVDGV